MCVCFLLSRLDTPAPPPFSGAAFKGGEGGCKAPAPATHASSYYPSYGPFVSHAPPPSPSHNGPVIVFVCVFAGGGGTGGGGHWPLDDRGEYPQHTGAAPQPKHKDSPLSFPLFFARLS